MYLVCSRPFRRGRGLGSSCSPTFVADVAFFFLFGERALESNDELDERSIIRLGIEFQFVEVSTVIFSTNLKIQIHIHIHIRHVLRCGLNSIDIVTQRIK